MFAVLNPRGRDPEQLFAEGAGVPDDDAHPPVNYHGYAACLRGGFYRSVDRVPESATDVLVLLRKKNLRAALGSIATIRARGGRAWVSLKESGQHQIADFLDDPVRLELFFEIAERATGYVSSTGPAQTVYRNAGFARGAFVPTPYPVAEDAWDFGIPLGERNGIFIGTREFDVPSRRHAETLLAAERLSRRLEVPVAVVNLVGRTGGMRLNRIRRDNPLFFIIDGPLDYPMYLRLMASHRVAFQLDRSAVPGQVAGDALLARMPCVGGNGAIDELVFGDDAGLDTKAAVARVEELLADDAAHARAVGAALDRAAESVSFAAGAARLRALFDGE